MARANGAAVSSSPGKSGFKACRTIVKAGRYNSCMVIKRAGQRIILQLGLAQLGGDGRSAKKWTLDPEEGQRNEEILNHLPKNIVQVTATLP